MSRVGGSAQTKAVKKVAGSLRLDLAQFRELEAFSAFASDLDKASKAQLERGQRLVELLKQPQFSPFSVERTTVSIWAGTTGGLDDVPVGDIRRFETEFLDYIARERKGIFDAIVATNNLEDATIEQLTSALEDFKKTFTMADGKQLVGDEPVGSLESPESKESITRHKQAPPADRAPRDVASAGNTAAE